MLKNLRNNLIMAPMAGVTDRFFRSIVWEYGAGLTVSEMVSAKSLVYQNKNTVKLLANDDRVRPWTVQFFSHEPPILAEAIRRLEAHPFDYVDINMGCPMPKIVNNGEGAALMKDPVLAGRLIEAAVKASPRPVTVKIRKGFTAATANAVEMAKVAQESGAAMIAVHGRFRDQYYTGLADWDAIAEVKNAVSIPVIGNGDINTPEEAANRLKTSGCDGVMIARGALGNPWIFSRTLQLLETGKLPPPPSEEEIIATALRHLNAFSSTSSCEAGCAGAKGLGGVTPNIFEMRKHLCWYTKGMHCSAEMRRKINNAKSKTEMEEILNKRGM